jgi:hypothetical protein
MLSQLHPDFEEGLYGGQQYRIEEGYGVDAGFT